jgi:hypothetical protein
MDISQLESNIEFLFEQVHNVWLEEKKQPCNKTAADVSFYTPDFKNYKREALVNEALVLADGTFKEVTQSCKAVNDHTQP